MIVITPYFKENPDWSYRDPRAGRTKLTDEVTEKVIDSYLDYMMHVHPQLNWDKLCDVTARDIEEYRQNKHRYTFETDQRRHSRVLVAVDGKKIEEDNYIGGLLVNLSDFE